MPLLNLADGVQTLKVEEVQSEPRVNRGERRSKWVETLEYVAGLYLDGDVDHAEMVQLATFTSANGAKAKQNELERKNKPARDKGLWQFKATTFIKDGGGRGSILWAAFHPFDEDLIEDLQDAIAAD